MEELIKNGFVFGNINIESELFEEIMRIQFNKDNKDSYLDWGYYMDQKDPVFQKIIDKLIEKVPSDFETMLKQLSSVELHYFEKEQFMPLHEDVGQYCFAQIILWIPDSEDYKGREFLYGTYEKVRIHKPKLGDFCLLYNMDPKFIHGVNTLQSENKIVTFTFELLKYKESNERIH